MRGHPAGRQVADDRQQRARQEEAQHAASRGVGHSGHHVRQEEDPQYVADRIGAPDRPVDEGLIGIHDRWAQHEQPDHARGTKCHDCCVDEQAPMLSPRLRAFGKPQQPNEEQHVEREIEGVDRRRKRHRVRCRLIPEGHCERGHEERERRRDPTPGRRGPSVAAPARGKERKHRGEDTGDDQRDIHNQRPQGRAPPP